MRLSLLLPAVIVFALEIANAQSAGFLHATNSRIIDGQGREVILRGMGLGGWMLQEGYMLGISKEGTQHSIKARITDLAGPEDCAKFYQLWLQNHMTRADVNLLAKAGFNSVRLPMHYNLFTLPIEQEPVKGQNTWLTNGFDLVDNLLSWCKANQIYLILDLHASPGGQGKDANISDADPSKPSLWESELNRQKTIALWRKLAQRYATEPWIGGYDLLNEPNWTFEGKDKNGKEDSSNQPIWDLYQAITRSIREVDKNHMIIIEGNSWGNNYNGFPGPWDSNMALSFHKYWNPNTPETIARFLSLRDKFHLPLWLGESGENSNQWFRECVALVEKNHIGWAWWPYKKVNSGSCVLTVKRPGDFKTLVDYWNKGGERPSAEVAHKALFELVENLKAANCRYNTNVVESLIPRETAEKPLYLDPAQPAEKRAEDLIARLTLEEKAMLLNHKGTTVERFGIKCDRWNQCLHGVWWDRPTTLFPVPIALAATWDSNLVHEVATAISDEARAIYNGWHQDRTFPGEHKGLIYRAPVINIERNPYWGRNEEAYGEDPYLTGRLGVAYVKGLQGNDPHYLKLVSTLKHYAVNNVEQGRTSLSATVPERMLYEYWLPHFRDCIVEGQAQSVMASYNAINGMPSNINPLLLTEILKQQWGFQGFVVSDLGGVNTMVTGHMKGRMTYEEAVAKSLIAGCDFSDKEFEAHLPAAIRQGLLPEARLNDAVFRVLRDRIRLGEFDPQELVPYSKIPTNVICSLEHRTLALKAARESIVLLVNRNHFLPLNKIKLKTIAVIGPHANSFTPGGYSGKAENPVKALQGIRNRAGQGTEVLCAGGCAISGGANEDDSITQAAAVARGADVAIVYVGTNNKIESEGHDRTSLSLPGRQEDLVKAVCAANPKTVVVLMNAGPLTVPWLKENVPALLETWWTGVEGGDAIADVLFGDVNPAGRLPHTVYASESQVPPQDEYDVTKGFTYMYLNGKPLFPFGHGLSYTTFNYSNLQVSPRQIPATGKVTVRVDVENTGKRPGDEVVQLYVHEVKCSVKRPSKELRGFERVALRPSQKKTVAFTLAGEKLSFWDVKSHGFVVEPGAFEVLVGSSSEDIRVQTRIQLK